MKRRLFNLLAMMSLLVFAVALVMCFRSYRLPESDWWHWRRPGGRYGYVMLVGLRSQIGSLSFSTLERAPDPGDPIVDSDGPWDFSFYGSPASAWNHLGFWRIQWTAWEDQTASKAIAVYSTYTIPYWLILAITAIPVLPWTIAIRRNRRRRALGLCQICGYDLRATPDRCPECGMIPREKKIASD